MIRFLVYPLVLSAFVPVATFQIFRTGHLHDPAATGSPKFIKCMMHRIDLQFISMLH